MGDELDKPKPTADPDSLLLQATVGHDQETRTGNVQELVDVSNIRPEVAALDVGGLAVESQAEPETKRKRRQRYGSPEVFARAETVFTGDEYDMLDEPDQNVTMFRYIFGTIKQEHQDRRLSITVLTNRSQVPALFISDALSGVDARGKGNYWKSRDLVSATVGILYEKFGNTADELPDIAKQRIQAAIERYAIPMERTNPGGEMGANSRNKIVRDYAERAIQHVARGYSSSAIIAGPPDSGKSSLVGYAESIAVREGRTVVKIDGKKFDMSSDQGLIRSIVTQIGIEGSQTETEPEIVDKEWFHSRDIADAVLGLLEPVDPDKKLTPLLVVDNYNIREQGGNQFTVGQFLMEAHRFTRRNLSKPDFGLLLFGFDKYDSLDRAPTVNLQFFTPSEIKELAMKLGVKGKVDVDEVKALTGGQPLLTHTFLQEGYGEQFALTSSNHVMRLAQMIVDSPEALMEFEQFYTSGGHTNILPALGVTTYSSDWTSLVYAEQLPSAVALLKATKERISPGATKT